MRGWREGRERGGEGEEGERERRERRERGGEGERERERERGRGRGGEGEGGEGGGRGERERGRETADRGSRKEGEGKEGNTQNIVWIHRKQLIRCIFTHLIYNFIRQRPQHISHLHIHFITTTAAARAADVFINQFLHYRLQFVMLIDK